MEASVIVRPSHGSNEMPLPHCRSHFRKSSQGTLAGKFGFALAARVWGEALPSCVQPLVVRCPTRLCCVVVSLSEKRNFQKRLKTVTNAIHKKSNACINLAKITSYLFETEMVQIRKYSDRKYQ